LTTAYTAGKSYATGETRWLYPQDEEPPKGQKLHILNEGGVSIQGLWKEDQGFMAFQRMFKRDHAKEAEYNTFLLMRKKAGKV